MDQTKRYRRTLVFGAAAIAGAALAVAGCGSSSSSSTSGATSTGSGSTFAALPYQTWCTNSKLCTYISKGSGGGITDFTNGVVDWGATDSPADPLGAGDAGQDAQRRDADLLPDLPGRDRRPHQRQRRQVAAVLGQDAGRHLRRHGHHLEQPRDRRRQPGRHAPERRDYGLRACRLVGNQLELLGLARQGERHVPAEGRCCLQTAAVDCPAPERLTEEQRRAPVRQEQPELDRLCRHGRCDAAPATPGLSPRSRRRVARMSRRPSPP